MIQTINADAYRSNEFLDLLAGKSARSSCKVFDFLRRPASDAKAPVCPTTLQTQIPAAKNDEKKNVCRNETKKNRKHQITCDHNLVMVAKEKYMPSSNKQSSKSQEAAMFDLKKHEIKSEHIFTILDVYKPIISLQLSKMFFTIVKKPHDDNKINTSKDLTDGEQKYNASSGIVEKLNSTNAKTSYKTEREKLELDLATRVKVYSNNQSFNKAYIIKLNRKVKKNNDTQKRVTFSRYVEVIEYFKPDYKKPLYDYEYDLK